MISKTEDSNKFPPVVLDTTLKDLIRSGSKDDAPLETLCMIKPHSDRSMGTAVPLSEKYIIHCAQLDDGDDLAHLQLEICSYLLLFFSGSMNCIFLACEGETNDESISRDVVDKNGNISFSVIQESQRPIIKTYANIEDLVAKHDGSKIRWGFGMDLGERLPYLFHPELIYHLNSKRWLAVSEDLKSANDNVLDCEINCADHQHENKWYYGGSDCEKCTAGIETEINRIHSILQKRPAPWVLKLTQSLSAVGTNIATDEKEKREIMEKISEYLNDYLPRVTKDNVHLHTTTLILSDCLDGDTMALNFFVRQDGSVVYLGACNQLATGETGRQTTAITYADQEQLEPKYRKVLSKIGRALNDTGYYGAVGADIMEDNDGNQMTIDLNVRTPLSLLLYLLKGHFYDSRGYGVAMVFECLMLKVSRDDFEDEFRKEFEDAKIVLLGSTRMGSKEQWAYGMVVAGKEKKDVDALAGRILELETK